MNVFLSTSLWDKAANADPGTIFINFERGWSIFPGHVHAKNLNIRSSDSNVQFLLHVDSCEFTVSLSDLVRHQFFHVTSIHGSGVTFHAKQRLPSPAATPEFVDALPYIPGFETIPLPVLGEKQVLERWDDRYWHLFTVQLENVVAEDVRDIWIDAMRWQGHATVHGGFYLKPIRLVHLDDIKADIDWGQLTITKRIIAEPMNGHFEINMPPFDPRSTTDLEKLRAVSLAIDFSGGTPDLANLPAGMFRPSHVSGAVEWRQLKLAMKDGKLTTGLHVDAALPAARFTTEDALTVGAEVSLLASIEPAAPGPQLTFRAEAKNAFGTKDEKILASVASAEIAGDARALDVARFLSDFHATAKLPDAYLPNFHALTPLVPESARSKLALEGGNAHAHGDLEIWWKDRRARGAGTLNAEGLDLRFGELRARGAAAVSGGFSEWHWEMQALDDAKAAVRIREGALAGKKPILDVRALLAEVNASEIDLASEQLRGTFTIETARLATEQKDHLLTTALHARGVIPDFRWGKGEISVQNANIVLTGAAITKRGAAESAVAIDSLDVTAASPHLRFADPFAVFTVKASLAGGRIRDAEGLNAFLPADSDLHLDARDGRLALEAEGVVVDHVGRGKVAVHGTHLGARGKKISLLGDVTAAVEVSEVDFTEGTMRVERSNVALTDVGVSMGAGKAVEAEAAPDMTAKRIELAASADKIDAKHPVLAGLDYHVVVSGAKMPDVRPLGDLLTSDPLKFGIDGGAAQADVDLTASHTEQTASGHALVVLEHADMHLKETKLAGNFQVALQVHGFDKTLDAVDISGSSITMRDVHTTGASAKATNWDGDIQLLGGALRLTKTPVFDGLIQLRADDATPILALALQNSLPKFLMGLAKADAMTGQARITIEPGSVAILGAHVRGGDVDLRGNYVAANHEVRGAVIVAKGPLSAGVKVDDAGTSVHLFQLDSWMKQETNAALLLYNDPKHPKAKATQAAAR